MLIKEKYKTYSRGKLMKVVHIIKRIETIDEDIKDLRKLEKSLSKDKSFSTPIYISIEKQINLLLDTRIKMLGLTIANPPADLVKEIEGEEVQAEEAPKITKKAKPKQKAKPKPKAKDQAEEADTIQIMTQDLIDEKFNQMKEAKDKEDSKIASKTTQQKDEDMSDEKSDNSDSVKLLDLALENGTLGKNSQDKEKKKVRFFKDNFPGGEY